MLRAGAFQFTWATNSPDDEVMAVLTTPPAPALSLGEVAELLGGGGALRPPYDAALRRAEALLCAAEGTVPAYDVGGALGERMQLEWKWACRCAEACGT